MNKQNEKYFVDTFPTFFKDIYGDPKKTCMSAGIAVGDGWKDLFNEVCLVIQKEIEKDPPAADFCFAQIKEKFGMLTIYGDGGNRKISQLLWDAAEKSTEICENCGSTTDVSSDGNFWIKTLCKVCHEKNTCGVWA